MKQFKLFGILTLSLFVMSAKANILTVNNSNPSPGQYQQVQDAINAASAGDTIYISGSISNYGSFNVDRRLTFIGTGHHPQNQNTLVSFMDNISISSINANRSKFIGLKFYQIYNTIDNIDSIYIQRCRVVYRVSIQNSFCSYWFVDGNVFENGGENVSHSATGNHDHIFYNNNIFNGYLNELSYVSYNNFIYVTNNIFLRNGNAFLGNAYYVYISNNIFYRATPLPSTVGCQWLNNCSYNCSDNSLPAGNFQNTDPMFVNFPSAGAYFDYTYDFHLQSGSPVHNGGSDGTDLGVYGGTVYFDQNGIPPIPQMRAFNITSPTTVPAGGTLNINFISTIKQ